VEGKNYDLLALFSPFGYLKTLSVSKLGGEEECM
jgi:hypothetical protein